MSKIPFTIRSSESYKDSKKKMAVYSTLSRKKDKFEPCDTSENPTVKIYVCGNTPYDSPHAGHCLTAMRFDVIRNYFNYRNLDVRLVVNVTDIDDKIINRCNETGEDPMELTQKNTDEFYSILDKMHVRFPDKLVKVSESLPEIISFIEKLIEKGAAYVTKDGNVYFDISSKEGYGKLSGQKTENLLDSVRIDGDDQKKSPLDFALWKRDESTSLSVDSPWGVGRPGWHIECSVMIQETLGTPIDIHGGGLDLKFPHHENEIAQSESYNDGDTFARFWMHGGLLTVDGTKMSKSLGNFMSLTGASDRFGYEMMRYALLVQHYRSNIDFSDSVFAEHLNTVWDFYKVLNEADNVCCTVENNHSQDFASVEKLVSSFEKAMNDDFNTPVALVSLNKALGRLRQIESGAKEEELPEVSSLAWHIREYGHVLGILHWDYKEAFTQFLNFHCQINELEMPEFSTLTDLIKDRQQARAAKDFEKADAVRDSLGALKLQMMDPKEEVTDEDRMLSCLRFN